MRVAIGLVVLCAAAAIAQKQEMPTFMGRKITVIDPGLKDEPGIFPKGPATVCIEGRPRRQCYTAPDDFGAFPKATVVEIEKNKPAVFFTAYGGGVSGRGFHFALLRPGTGNALDILTLSDPLSDQSQYAFWDEPSISGAKIFVTADRAWVTGDVHFGAHRTLISAYVWKPMWIPRESDPSYYLEDRYLTIRSYDLGVGADDALTAERPEILARLRRVKAEESREQGAQ